MGEIDRGAALLDAIYDDVDRRLNPDDGTKTEKIKQIGNAVSVAKMKACVAAIMADAAPARRPAKAAEEEPDPISSRLAHHAGGAFS